VAEIELPGGFVNVVVRVGDTVRRTRPANAAFVERLLAHLERRRWPGAPRFLGVDDRGRETLTYMEGHVAWQPHAHSVDSLAAVARLVREFHDLTAGTDLAGDHEVVCHNDLSPKNTVYDKDFRPIAFIDWDIAAPGKRVHDVAHVCWQYVALGPSVTDVADAARKVRAIADAYGLADTSTLVDTILWWQDRCWRGIEAEASAGVEAAARLRALGHVEAIRDQYTWTAEQRPVLDEALSR
jgi:aminoglycoside phosphotransferase (APT) family kinase protein